MVEGASGFFFFYHMASSIFVFGVGCAGVWRSRNSPARIIRSTAGTVDPFAGFYNTSKFYIYQLRKCTLREGQEKASPGSRG